MAVRVECRAKASKFHIPFVVRWEGSTFLLFSETGVPRLDMEVLSRGVILFATPPVWLECSCSGPKHACMFLDRFPTSPPVIPLAGEPLWYVNTLEMKGMDTLALEAQTLAARLANIPLSSDGYVELKGRRRLHAETLAAIVALARSIAKASVGRLNAAIETQAGRLPSLMAQHMGGSLALEGPIELEEW